jgi:hypothetical protein
MRRVAEAFKTTSIKALEAETELMSTKQRLYNKHRKYAVRMLQVTETHNIRQCIDEYENEHENKNRIDTQISYITNTLQQNINREKLKNIEMFIHES